MKLSSFRCPICGKATQTLLDPCVVCQDALSNEYSETCTQCSADLAGSDNPCPQCRTGSAAIDGIKALGAWSGVLREWLSSFKYGGDSRTAGQLAKLLLSRWEEEWTGIPVVPVPPRFMRVFRDGFDPVGLIADSLKSRGVPVEKLLLRKGGQTQKSLTREERLAGAALDFRFRRSTQPGKKDYVMLDDVTSTGATLNKCAEMLKSAGVQRVFALVVCRA